MRLLTFILLFCISNMLMAQNINTRSSEFKVDMSEMKGKNTDVPKISWKEPIPDINFQQEEGSYPININITGENPIKKVTIDLIDLATDENIGKQNITPTESEINDFNIKKNLFLLNGEISISIIVENQAGIQTVSSKKVYVGSEAIAQVSQLDRTDYAILFATDKYEHWDDLVNPIYDARTISEILSEEYGFKVEVVENASQNEILSKLREYSRKKYKPMDQLFVFFAGHGTYDQTFGEGFVVTKESLVNDDGKTTYLSHNRLRSIVNNIPSEHIFLTMDVCFGGTFDQKLASARGGNREIYKDQNKSDYISRKLMGKTRKYLTSGGKTYVSDGIKGEHSPFAKRFIEALNSQGGNDGILTISELYTFVERLSVEPRLGNFGNNELGSDFLFVVK
ncbi:MAG: caspase family protein [Bacteroidota bacterium]